MCTHCEDPYYSGGYHQGCFVCPNITQCKHRSCTDTSNTVCKECHENNAIFKIWSNEKECQRMCAWNNHYCWPGTCSTNGLTKDCTCANGFDERSTVDYGSINAGETTCQLNTIPDILTCDTVAVGPNGDKKRAMSTGNSTACQYLADMYGNYQPSTMEFTMSSEFAVNISLSKPSFIEEETFGISDTTITIKIQAVIGSYEAKSIHTQLVDASSSTSVKQAHQDFGNITVNQAKYSLQNGEALCLEFEAKAGGYLKSIDTRADTQIPSGPVPYTKVTKQRTVCYRYDNAPPEHCSKTGSCSSEPLTLQKRVTRSTVSMVQFNGWVDPVPSGGASKTASTIESYQITVNEVPPSNGTLKVDYTKSIYTRRVPKSDMHEMELNLTSNSPRLYCITLEVKDVADNVGQSRRFMLFDNTSFIETWKENSYKFDSASPETNFTWQTHHNDICLNWKNYFINMFYLKNELLNKIESEPHGQITGVYEQTTGLLPVGGTPNVHGIIQYFVSWKLNNGAFTEEQLVPNVLNQRFCTNLNVADGQTYTFNIRPVDIVDNTFNESRTVYIDRSPPHINNIWLKKDGYEMLYVHNSTDLSKMQMTFDALDPHSGLQNIKWEFGIADTSTALTSGYLSVVQTTNATCPTGNVDCYCPDIGMCEFFNYSIPLNKLIEADKHTGNHNRNYFFKITVTNNALLTTTEHIDVLIDESPPEEGVIYEGPGDYKDIDYTSEDSFVVHWHGFIDHESGIKLYRLGLASRCLTKEELYNFTEVAEITVYKELTDTSVRLLANFTGKRFITIIALNHAMESSKPVCSDGITRDISAALIRNLTLAHAAWTETVICQKGQPYLLQSNLQKVPLYNTTACFSICVSTIDTMVADYISTHISGSKDLDISDFLCRHLSLYTNETVIYLPNDHIVLNWEVEESESQIDDFFVGLGLDATEKDSPSLVDYISTDSKPYVRHRHEALGSDELFYVFIKTVNKAGLFNIATLGPILIDQTPPRYKYIPRVTIALDTIVFAWESDTFYDDEQTAQIDQLVFQFGHEEIVSSPLLEWRLESSTPCPSYTGGCFKYPLNRLQNQDTGDGLMFYLNVYIYNNAGHFTSIRTETFHLPSRFPPGHGYVFDLDPEMMNISTDIDFHFTEHMMCVGWMGFKHHENVSLEVGIGLDRTTPDIVRFQNTSEMKNICLKSSSIVNDNFYFFIVKASCSGGTTISASNGVRIYDRHSPQNEMKIKIGENCFSTKVCEVNVSITNDGTFIELPCTLIIGQRYLLFAEKSEWQNILSINTSDALVQTEDNNYVLIPFVEKPTLQVHRNVSMDMFLRLKISKCPAENIVSNNNQLTISWTFPHTTTIEDIVFSVSLLKYVSVNGSDEESIFAPPQHLIGLSGITFHDMNFGAQTLYMASVQLCNNVRCLSPIHSMAFTIELEAPDISFINSELKVANAGECVDVKASWKIIGQSENVAFYQWSVSRDEIGGQLLSVWENVLPNGTTAKVAMCVRLPTHGHITTFLCVRVFSVSGLAKTSCHKINKGDSGSYSKTAVYDFDSSSDSWVYIKKMLHSSDIGQHYVRLHDSEMNIGNADSSVTGALMYGSERSVSWYLMKLQYVPQTCDSDINCVIKYESDYGYIELDKHYISFNELYFICAYSNYTVVEREYFTEILEEISSCSNGFILDSSPPTKGEVHVHNHRGFITNPQHVIVTWTGFHDNIDATVFGFPEKLHYFSIRTGTSAGSSNILDIVRTSMETSAILDLSAPPDGSQVFFTVNATDYASLSTSSDSLELIIDTSPPLCGGVTFLNNLQRNIFINQELATVRFEGFSDPHSGLSYFNVGVGTMEGVTNIMADTKVFTNFFEFNLAQMIDGHLYFIIVQAINRAGLVSQYVSKRFVLDRTAPTGGHVLDGIKGAGEIDYQTDIYVISAYWKEFYDAESGLAFFKVGLGNDPYESDVRPLQDVGMMTEVSWNGPFVPGQKYFVTVEACNNANLCTRRVSDGLIVDNSPPERGLVHIGPGEGHDKYLGHRSSIRISWQGFEDPQSDIDHFEVCVSTPKGDCDVVVLSNRLLHSSIIISNITLPMNISLMATVWAFNGVGMNVSKASDIFVIDDTPPVVVRAPKFLLKYNSDIGKKSQWEKSILRFEWEFKDDISPIVRHEISLKTHHEGHTPVERLVLGSERHVTVSLDGRNWLNNGDTYYAIVTSCNAAGLCASERTSDLLIDSTPPHLGGFKPPLTWTNYNNTFGSNVTNVSLTWYGFHDQESGIENYYVTVSRSYSFNELSNGVIRIRETNQSETVKTSFVLTESISPDESIILSIWAQNNVGLNSSIARVTVNVLSETSKNKMGILEIEKHSCDIHFCNKDCTCAVIDRPCVVVSSNKTCTAISSTDAHTKKLPHFDVYWGLPHEILNVSASSACLSGHWSRTNGRSTSENIHRFEWSLGVHGHAVGEGVYDLKLENPWSDVGQRLQFIHCLPVNRSFVHGELYVIYVKVWYSKSTYTVFKSSPIMIDQTPPKVKRGRYIREGNCFQDLDFIDWTDNIIACWEDLFTEEQSLIDHFSVSLGTSPNNDDILQQIDVGLATNISLHNISLNPGTRYYFTVIAVNSVGLHTGLASDGFIIDTDNPIHGVVFNTIGHKNADFQKSTSNFELSWHGFQDHFSGIKHYLIALVKDGEYNESNLTFTNVGLSNKYAFTNLNLVNGESYFGVVKAIDAAGHESAIVRCPKQTIDTTPPKGFSCGSTKTIEVGVSRKVTDESLSLWFNANVSKDNMYVIHGNIKNATYVLNPILQMDKYSLPLPLQKRQDGWFEYNYMFISPLEGLQTITLDFGNILAKYLIQNVDFEVCKLAENNSAAISVNQIGQYSLTVSLRILDSESELQTVSVGVGTTEGGFEIKPLFELHNRNNFGVIIAPFVHGAPIFITAIAKNHAGLTSVFYSGKALTIDHTPPTISDIAVAVSIITDTSTKLLTTWTAQDDESDVQYCSCLIGSAPLSADIHEERDSDTLQFCATDIPNLFHGDRVFVTVKCVNKVEIATTLVSRPVIIYLEPPNNSEAFVRFLPSGQESFSMTGPLSVQSPAQSNSSVLQMECNNFEDPSEITSYSYRIQSNGEIVVDWTDAGIKDMFSNEHLQLKSGQTYTTEVHALNGGGFTSSDVKSSLIVALEPPELTGSHISAVFANGKLSLNWENVFNRIPGVPVHYSLIIGSRDGFSDIADVNYTRNHVYDVIVPSSTLVSSNLNELYIKVSCTYSTGMYTTYSTSYKL
ncbi:uncharacterized protein LOC127837360 isoform X3 [Dreissena polymorpha]|nr:uncharacterized protein LOC127837360 isoform X3 [Dreissena polymorpha]